MMWQTMSIPIGRRRTVSESMGQGQTGYVPIVYNETSGLPEDAARIPVHSARRRSRTSSLKERARAASSSMLAGGEAPLSAVPNLAGETRRVRAFSTPHPVMPTGITAGPSPSSSSSSASPQSSHFDATYARLNSRENVKLTLRHYDVCPKTIKGIKEDYESFDEVIKAANKWLTEHSDTQLVTVETLTWQALAKNPIFTDSAMTARARTGAKKTRYLRGLRIWYYSRGERFWTNWAPKRRLGYRDYVPGKGSVLSSLLEMNKQLQEDPIQGSILRFETLYLPHELESTASAWVEHSESTRTFDTVLRLIYLEFDGAKLANAEVAIRDFCPNVDSRSAINNGYEAFKDTFGHAARWLYQLKNFQVLNLQTLKVKAKSTTQRDGLDKVRLWECSSHKEFGDKPTDYFLILRVAYLRPLGEVPPTLPPRLTYRSFTPSPAGRGSDNGYEETSSTVDSISEWLSRSEALLVGVETVPIRCESAGQQSIGPEASTLTHVPDKSASSDEAVLYTIRIYLDGDYNNIPVARKWRPPTTSPEPSEESRI